MRRGRAGFVARHGAWLAPVVAVCVCWYLVTLGWYLAQEPREANPSYLPLWATLVAWPLMGLLASGPTLGLAALAPAAAGYGLWWLACVRPGLRRRPSLAGVRAELLDGRLRSPRAARAMPALGDRAMGVRGEWGEAGRFLARARARDASMRGGVRSGECRLGSSSTTA